VRALLLPLALGASACGGPSAAFACLTDPFVVQAAHELDCDAVADDVTQVRAALESDTAPARWRLALGEFDEAMAGVPIFVHADETFPRDGRTWVGRYSVVEGIELGSRGDALPHEMMHAIDVHRGEWFTGTHSGWDWTFDDAVTAKMSAAWTTSEN